MSRRVAVAERDHRLTALRLVGPKSPAVKEALLREAIRTNPSENRSRHVMEAAR